MRKVFKVEARWDDEAKVFFSVSDISGLHIEADSLEEFEEILFEVAPELVVANHFSGKDIQSRKNEDAIPAIVYKQSGCDLQFA